MKKAALGLLVLVSVGLGIWWWFSPTQQVKRKTRALVELLCFHGGASPSLMEMHRLTGLIGSDMEVEVPEMDIERRLVSRDEVQSAYNWLHKRAQASDFDLVEYKLAELVAGRAEVQVVLDGAVDMPKLQKLIGYQQVVLIWQDEGSGWKLTQLRWIDYRQ